jgi:hypothetical protein
MVGAITCRAPTLAGLDTVQLELHQLNRPHLLLEYTVLRRMWGSDILQLVAVIAALQRLLR